MEKSIITNWLFSKPVLNHCIPFPTDGHKIYPCNECGDKFIFESSYECHINRKVIQITYTCKKCNKVLNFKNRCRFLQHLRMHISKTITINYTDLSVNLLPLEDFLLEKASTTPLNTEFKRIVQDLHYKIFVCFECTQSIPYYQETLYQVRSKHFLRYTGQNYKCPVCMYTLSNVCALGAHMHIHLQKKPFLCCDCGKTIQNSKSVLRYPFSHECDGFRSMRLKARVKCPIGNSCQPFHPSNFTAHLMETHVKKFRRCLVCMTDFPTGSALKTHLDQIHKGVHTSSLIEYMYRCLACKTSFQVDKISTHLKSHFRSLVVYPCWQCNAVHFDNVPSLLEHHIACQTTTTEDSNKMYNVQKRCEKCKRIFCYKCKRDEIDKLPTDCPHCVIRTNPKKMIKCPLCAKSFIYKTVHINNHFAKFHKEMNINAELRLSRCDKLALKYTKKKVMKSKIVKRSKTRSNTKTNIKTSGTLSPKTSPIPINTAVAEVTMNTTEGQWKCIQCDKVTFADKELLKEHLRSSHRDPCAAYQCLECGQCFIVQRSFTTHLKVEHNILDSDKYINDNKCYNEDALNKQNKMDTMPEIILNKDQCKICLEQFDNADNLKKHFRIHGMAYLLEKQKANNEVAVKQGSN